MKQSLLLICLVVVYCQTRLSHSASEPDSSSIHRNFLVAKKIAMTAKLHANLENTTPLQKHLLIYYCEIPRHLEASILPARRPLVDENEAGSHAESHILPFVTTNFHRKISGQGSSHHKQLQSIRVPLHKHSVDKIRAQSEEQARCEQSHHHTNDSLSPILTKIFLMLSSSCGKHQESMAALMSR